MGQVKILTNDQKLILDEFRKDPILSSNFYFTGGTALSFYYFQHRYSIDLDFFSEKKFDPKIIFNRVSLWSKKHKFTYKLKNIEELYTYLLTFSDGRNLKVDFSHYPYKLLRNPKSIDGLKVDSRLDIAVNKITAIVQRSEVKDFVDLYFLLNEFSLWDLIEGVRIKFNMEIDPICLGNDFYMVEDFNFMPEMVKPLKLTDLQKFFTQKSREVAGRVVEE